MGKPVVENGVEDGATLQNKREPDVLFHVVSRVTICSLNQRRALNVGGARESGGRARAAGPLNTVGARCSTACWAR
jgi:hypothetical protein